MVINRNQYCIRTMTSKSSKLNFKPLTTLSARQLVKHADILDSYSSYIPSTLYETLLHAAVETDRVLSIKILVINWPFEELILENCKHFKPHHATLIAHSLSKTRKQLRKLDLTGCKTGKEGTELFLKLALGNILPKLSDLYCAVCMEPCIEDESSAVMGDPVITDEQGTDHVLPHLTIDCYCSKAEYRMLMDVLQQQNRYHLSVANLYTRELGFRRIKKLLKRMAGNEMQVSLGDQFGFKIDLSNCEVPMSSFVENIIFMGSLETKVYGMTSKQACKLNIRKLIFIRPALKGLHFAMNGLFPITDVVAGETYEFASLGQFMNLKYLNLSNNAIGFKTLYNILQHLHKDVQLTHLIVRSCAIGHYQKYWDEMAGLTCLKKLEHLDVAYNKLRVFDGLKKITSQCATTLKKLDVSGNGFGDDFIDFVQMILRPPFNLVDLNICKNNLILSPKDLDDLNKIDCRTITF